MDRSRSEKHPSAAGDTTIALPHPRVSIVLPVRNEAKYIRDLLEDVLSQEEPDGGFEVIVVDGRSTDDTRAIVEDMRHDWPNLVLVDNPRRLSSSARNIGARVARGDYVMYLDGHCSIPRSDYLVRLVGIFESTGAACLCRPQPLRNLAEGHWARIIAVARHSRLGHNPGSDIYEDTPGFTDPTSAGAAYLRSSIEQLGGFDERFDACEDVEFNHRVARARLTAFRHPDLAIHYQPRRRLDALFTQMSRYGRGRARLMAVHGTISFPLMGITLTAGAALLLAALGLWKPVLVVLGAVGAMGILLFLLEGYRLDRSMRDASSIALALLVIYAGLVAGFWRGLLEFRRFRNTQRIGMER